MSSQRPVDGRRPATHMRAEGGRKVSMSRLLRLLGPVWAGRGLWSSASSGQMPPTAPSAIPLIPSNEARIWFYRDLAIYSSLATPIVRLNGAAVGGSQPGGAFYRDVPPGHYHISADSYLDDPNQDRDVDLAPGQEAYAKILPPDHWIQGGGRSGRATARGQPP